MNYSGLIIALITFLVIGLFHPIVIKGEYYFGTRCWWVFALSGVVFIAASLLVEDNMLSPILGVVGCSCLWSILEIFEQKKRVEKGWFPMNPSARTNIGAKTNSNSYLTKQMKHLMPLNLQINVLINFLIKIIVFSLFAYSIAYISNNCRILCGFSKLYF